MLRGLYPILHWVYNIMYARDKSLPATAEQMVRIVLKGSNQTYDSLVTDYRAKDNTFIILTNEFKKRTAQD